MDSHRERSNRELVELCRKGDGRAWQEIVSRYESLVYSVPLRWYDLPREEAEDVCQETFLALLKGLDRIRNAESLPAWLIGAAMRISKNRLRKTKRRARLLESLEAVGGEKEIHRGTDLQEIALVERALEALDPACREILRLRYLVQPPVSYEGIAERLGVAVGTVGPWRARCMKRVLAYLRRNRYESEVAGETAGSVS